MPQKLLLNLPYKGWPYTRTQLRATNCKTQYLILVLAGGLSSPNTLYENSLKNICCLSVQELRCMSIMKLYVSRNVICIMNCMFPTRWQKNHVLKWRLITLQGQLANWVNFKAYMHAYNNSSRQSSPPWGHKSLGDILIWQWLFLQEETWAHSDRLMKT